MLATTWTNFCHHPCPAVHMRVRTDTFWTGSGVCSSLELILVGIIFLLTLVTAADKAQDPVLHDQSDYPVCQYQHTYTAGLLSAGRLRRENLHLHFHHAVVEVT